MTTVPNREFCPVLGTVSEHTCARAHTTHTCLCYTPEASVQFHECSDFLFLESWPICPQVCFLCWAVPKDAVFSMWGLLSDTTSTAIWIHTRSCWPREVHFHHNSFTLFNIVRELLAHVSTFSASFAAAGPRAQPHSPAPLGAFKICYFQCQSGPTEFPFVYPGQSSLTDCWDSKAYNPDKRMVMTGGETTAEETKRADWQPLRGWGDPWLA